MVGSDPADFDRTRLRPWDVGRGREVGHGEVAASRFGTAWPPIRERLVGQGLQSDGTHRSHLGRRDNRVGVPIGVLAAGQDRLVGKLRERCASFRFHFARLEYRPSSGALFIFPIEEELSQLRGDYVIFRVVPQRSGVKCFGLIELSVCQPELVGGDKSLSELGE